MAGLVYDLLPQETYLLEQPLVTDVGYELVSPSISSQIIKNQILNPTILYDTVVPEVQILDLLKK
jgi:hypothetical protein